jgi:hypothetical protein
MGMNNCHVGGFFVHFPMNPVLARCFRGNLSFQRDKDRFCSNIKVRAGPFDKKTGLIMAYADVPEIAPNKVLRKEPFTNPFEFISIHEKSLSIHYLSCASRGIFLALLGGFIPIIRS